MFASSTKRTIAKILSLYLGTSLVLLCGLFYFVYKKETRNIYYEQVISLREVSLGITEILKKYPNNLERALTEIRESRADLAFGIFSKRGEVVFSNLLVNPTHEEFLEGFYKIDDRVVLDPEAFAHRHYKPTRFPYRIFIQDENVDSLIITNNIKLGVYFVLILLAMGIVAYFLVRLFLKPIHNHIQRLDSFIKDTTHEINTPISIILMSVEMLQTKALSSEDKKKITRIKLASLQLEHIYRTLVAYNFPHSLPQTKQRLRLDLLLCERLEFFAPFLAQKSLTLRSDLAPAHLYANREKIITLFDNLLSNAIKYNKHNGEISIILREGYCAMRDSGSGIDSKHRAMIFERFARFDKSVGGFGIGLSLVREICREYGIRIRVQSAQEAQSQSGVDTQSADKGSADNASNAHKGGSAFVLTWDLEAGDGRADSQ